MWLIPGTEISPRHEGNLVSVTAPIAMPYKRIRQLTRHLIRHLGLFHTRIGDATIIDPNTILMGIISTTGAMVPLKDDLSHRNHSEDNLKVGTQRHKPVARQNQTHLRKSRCSLPGYLKRTWPSYEPKESASSVKK